VVGRGVEERALGSAPLHGLAAVRGRVRYRQRWSRRCLVRASGIYDAEGRRKVRTPNRAHATRGGDADFGYGAARLAP
jgi:hypothetical protein